MKVFRVVGEIQKTNLKTPFRKEVLAVKPEHAVEKIYTELGSRHRVKRFHIKISKVEEVALQDVEDLLIKKLMVGEEKIGKQS